jgi:hypothetical protein
MILLYEIKLQIKTQRKYMSHPKFATIFILFKNYFVYFSISELERKERKLLKSYERERERENGWLSQYQKQK